jgi:TolA-binding protein
MALIGATFVVPSVHAEDDEAKKRALLDVKEEGNKDRAVLDVKERKRPGKKEKRVPPQLRRSAVLAIKIEKELLAKIDTTTSYLYKTADGLPKKSAQRLQILERILNLKMEQASYERSEEERLYDKDWKAWDEAGGKGPEPKLSTKRSEEHWKTVIQVSTEITKEYPKSKSGDVITYNKAVGLQYLGKEKAAARIFSLLIQKYPNSDIAGDAYASLGDYYFDRNDFRNAQSNYEKATRYKRSKRYLWSVFKLGWCAYNLGQHRQALAQWKAVVRQSRMGGDQGLQLKDEALRDMVYAFAEIGDVEGAIAYYRANGGDKFIGPFLLLLSSILSDHGSYARAVDVLKRYQRVAPTAEDGPGAQKEIVSLYYALNKMPQVWRELERFPMLYGPKSVWAAKNDKKVVAETQDMIKDQILYYSTLTHQRAIKDNDRGLNQEAKKGYQLYLKTYPGDKHVVGIKYLLADIAYFLKDYREAGGYYMDIGSLGPKKAIRYDLKTGKPSNIHQEVAIDMVRSFVKDFETEFKVLKKAAPNFKRPRPLSMRAKNYIAACEKYSKWYPKDAARVKSCHTSIAAIHYGLGQEAPAVKALKVLAFKYSNTKEGAGAVDLLIPLVKDDKKQMLKLTSDFLKMPAYKSGPMGDKLRALQRGSEKESIAKERNTLKRAKLFEAQARKYPKDPEVDKLWYNAATDYIKAGAINNALVCYNVIVQKFPKNPQVKTSHLQIAKILEKQMEYDKASTYFLSFAAKYPQEKETPGSLSKACELLLALNSDKALKVCTSFAQRYPEGSSAIINRLIVGAERAKQYKKMEALIYSYYLPKYKLTPNERIVTLARIYKIGEGKSPESAKAQQEMVAIFKQAGGEVSGEALRYIGEISYKGVPGVIAKYKEVKLVGGTVEKLLASIQGKAAAMQQAEAALTAVLNTKDAYWGVAALYQLGMINELYAEALENPPAIQGASLADVKKELAPQVADRKKVALERYKTAFDTVNKYKVYNDWSVKTVSAIWRVRGSRFEFEDFVMRPDFLETQIPSNFAGKVKGDNRGEG